MTPKPVTRKPGSMPRIRTVGAGIRGLFRIEDQGSRIKDQGKREGIGESIRVRSLKDPPARCKRALEAVLDGPQSGSCQFRSPGVPPSGAIGASAGRARLGAPVGGTAALEVPHPLRQELMNLLRSSPFRFLRFACLSHSPARSCLTCRLALATVLLPSRHALMNFLRASPFSFFSPACLLQALMRSCCFWA